MLLTIFPHHWTQQHPLQVHKPTKSIQQQIINTKKCNIIKATKKEEKESNS
jgi:hypothetical protein